MLRATFEVPQAAAYAAPAGPWDVPDLHSLLGSAGVARVDALVEGDRVWSSSEIESRVDALAASLRERGAGRGVAVTWQLPNCIESVLLYRACWRAGAVAVALHDRAGEREVAAMVETVSPAVVVRSAEEVASLVEAGSGSGSGVESGSGEAGAQVRPDELAVVLFTAGSTGGPKGVMHTHRALAYKARTMVAAHGLTAADAVLMPAPLAHVSGLLNGILVPGVAGMKCVLQARWNPAQALATIEREQVTFMVGPPTFFTSLMDDPSFARSAVRSLRLISCGGAGVSPSFVERAELELGAVVKRSYGSTEAPTVATSSGEDRFELRRDFDGRAVGAAELSIRSPVDGEPLPHDEEGELWVRGPELFAGYLSRDETDAVVTADGWFRTGDLACMTSSGWLTITGRLKEVVIRSGENISIAEVEAVLERHPAVREAAVIGATDARTGERVVAFVVLASDARPFGLDECRAWFEAEGVARFKTPEDVHVVDRLPLLPSGKVDRRALRAGG